MNAVEGMKGAPVDAVVDVKTLKASGIIPQKDPDLYTVRIQVVGGHLESAQLSALAAISEKYGQGQVHLTTRQGVEIPGVHQRNLEALRRDLAGAGLRPAPGGNRVRGIVACPGGHCRCGLIDPQALAKKLGEYLGSRDGLPHKFKISITGCPNSCAKPQENDLGIMGTKDGLAVFVGGKVGKRPRWADRLPILVADDEALLRVANAIIDWYIANGAPKERLGATIDRVGRESLEKNL